MRILPIFIPHLGCPFACVYCNQHQITKTQKPDLDNIFQEAQNFCRKNKNLVKEIAFFGGTFTGLPALEQKKILDRIAPLLDDKTAIRISTRPDKITPEILEFLSAQGVKTIELGIQSFSDQVLAASKRGYSSHTARLSCQLIQQHGFDLGIQIMPGLPGFSTETLRYTLDTIIQLKPKFVRIYPTIVLADTELGQLYQAGLYKPLSLEKAIELAAQIFWELSENQIPVSKLGLHSDLDPAAVWAGPYHQSFGELVRAKILSQQITSQYLAGHTIHISQRDISLFRGFGQTMLSNLKSELNISQLPIIIDPTLAQSQFKLSLQKAEKIW
ncbi:MAG: radical SAM protein [Candidatus Cloacimonadales bacterium]